MDHGLHSGSVSSAPAKGIYKLPADVLLELFATLTGPELVNLAFTNKYFYSFLHENSLWGVLCASYGLYDLSHFIGLTFRTVYTRLLYPYGPLIGLWANDHPYRGNILQFRLHVGSETEAGGIIGSIWRLPSPFAHGPPVSLVCIPIVKIHFATHMQPNCRGAGDDVVITCHHNAGDTFDVARLQLVCMKVVSGASRAIFHQAYRQTIPHPDFPGTDCLWYDTDDRLPRIRPTTPKTYADQSSMAYIYPAVRLPIIFTAPSLNQYVPPSGLSFHCPHAFCAMVHSSPHAYESILPFFPLYYPIQSCHYIRGGGDQELSCHGIWFTQTIDPLCLYTEWQRPDGTIGRQDDLNAHLKCWVLFGSSSTARGTVLWDVKRATPGEDEYVGQYLRVTNTLGKPITQTVSISVKLETSHVMIVAFPDGRPMRCHRFRGPLGPIRGDESNNGLEYDA